MQQPYQNLYYSNGKYYGQIKQTLLSKKPNGTGLFIWDNQQVYYGQWQDGIPQGKGYLFQKDGSIVKAIIKEGKCEGCLFIYFPNKNLFKGKVKGGILEEKGLYYENKSQMWVYLNFQNGQIKQEIKRGQGKDGQIQGKGRAYFGNGDMFDGYFKNGKFEHQGVYNIFDEKQYFFGLFEQNKIVTTIQYGESQKMRFLDEFQVLGDQKQFPDFQKGSQNNQLENQDLKDDFLQQEQFENCKAYLKNQKLESTKSNKLLDYRLSEIPVSETNEDNINFFSEFFDDYSNQQNGAQIQNNTLSLNPHTITPQGSVRFLQSPRLNTQESDQQSNYSVGSISSANFMLQQQQQQQISQGKQNSSYSYYLQNQQNSQGQQQQPYFLVQNLLHDQQKIKEKFFNRKNQQKYINRSNTSNSNHSFQNGSKIFHGNPITVTVDLTQPLQLNQQIQQFHQNLNQQSNLKQRCNSGSLDRKQANQKENNIFRYRKQKNLNKSENQINLQSNKNFQIENYQSNQENNQKTNMKNLNNQNKLNKENCNFKTEFKNSKVTPRNKLKEITQNKNNLKSICEQTYQTHKNYSSNLSQQTNLNNISKQTLQTKKSESKLKEASQLIEESEKLMNRSIDIDNLISFRQSLLKILKKQQSKK